LHKQNAATVERLPQMQSDSSPNSSFPPPAPKPFLTLIKPLNNRWGGSNIELVPVHKWPICPISALLEKFNPRNINHADGVIKFFERLARPA
jgi:hypothetical protein